MTTIAVHAVKGLIGAMNMNREECERAYADLEVCREVMRESIERNGEIINPVSSFDKAMVMFARLIEDHFDNPPLKFEEITEDEVPYWDKIEQTWCLVSGEGDEVCIYSIFGTDIPKYITKYNFISKYENRFYRKQVEE